MNTFAEDIKKLEDLYNSHEVEAFKTLFAEMHAKYPSEEQRKEILSFINGNYKKMKEKIDETKHQISIYMQLEQYKEIIPMSYIARTYFGKSASWLQQRVYGYPVRGQVYTLKPSEVETLNSALHDIGSKLSLLTIKS